MKFITIHGKTNHVWFLMLFLMLIPSRPARAQLDLTGEWSPRVYNDHMDVGDYTGIPLNEAGRLRAESWHPEQLDLPENLCRPHPIDIGLRVSVSPATYYDGTGQRNTPARWVTPPRGLAGT